MANQTRKRFDFITGTVFNNPLSNSGTTLNATGLIALPAVDATEHMAIVLDPIGAGNGPEVVWVTSHTAGTSTATIVRGREGTTGVSHTSTMTWAHAPTLNDYRLHVTAATRPSGTGIPYQGQNIYETDTFETLEYNGVNWRRPWMMPWGIVSGGYISVSADQTGITTAVTPLTSLTLTFTAVANRRYRVTGDVQAIQRTSFGTVTLYLKESTSILKQRGDSKPAADYSSAIHLEHIVTPTVGSHTYFLAMNTDVNTCDLLASGGSRDAWLLIEDIGPNGVPT